MITEEYRRVVVTVNVRHVRLLTFGVRASVGTLGERCESIIGSVGMDERVRGAMLKEVTTVRPAMKGGHRARVMARALLIASMLVIDRVFDVQEVVTCRRLTMPKVHQTVRRPTVDVIESELQYENDMETVVH